MEKGLQFTGEEIVYLYLHLDNYRTAIKEQLERDLKLSRAQLRMIEDVYGDDEDFDKEKHKLSSQLVNEEIPALLKIRLGYIEKMRDKFKDGYELILDVDPDFVENIKKEQFEDSENITDLIEQIKNKDNNGY